jgi:inosose dehydratase
MRLDKLGHTGITWPFTPDGARTALGDLAGAGYRGVELFGFVLDDYPGGLDAVRDDLDAAGLQYTASYCSVSLVDPQRADADLASMQRWAGQVAALGGEVVVVGPDPRTRGSYDREDHRRIAASLDEIGRRCADLGVLACFHPHTGTPVETPEEIAQVMDAVDARWVGMAPDTGQIAKGGGDPAEVLATYRDLVRHVHLKDYVGGLPAYDPDGNLRDRTGYLDYTPVGQGVLDVPALLAAVGPAYDGWWMVELDGTDEAPQTPAQAAAASKDYLDLLPEPVAGTPGRG